MKTLIFCILSFLMISCSVSTWDKPSELFEEEHLHGVDTHIHEEDEWDLFSSTGWDLNATHEPVIPVSDFWASIDGVSQVSEYIKSLSWSTIKMHGSLYQATGGFLWDTEILYWYSNWDSFETLWSINSDQDWQYYFKLIATQIAQEFFYIEIKIWDIISRVYFVPNTFNANDFIKQYNNLPNNMYFAKVVMLEDDIITGVDILADPS